LFFSDDFAHNAVDEVKFSVNWDLDRILLKAAAGGQSEVVKHLLEHANTEFDDLDDSVKSSLHLACENGHLAVVKYLVESMKADVNLADREFRTPVFIASSNGHLHVVEYLVEDHNVDVHETAELEATPITCACENGDLDMVEYLVEHAEARLTTSITLADPPSSSRAKKTIFWWSTIWCSKPKPMSIKLTRKEGLLFTSYANLATWHWSCISWRRVPTSIKLIPRTCHRSRLPV
jgi:ankyrin repeat protein